MVPSTRPRQKKFRTRLNKENLHRNRPTRKSLQEAPTRRQPEVEPNQSRSKLARPNWCKKIAETQLEGETRLVEEIQSDEEWEGFHATPEEDQRQMGMRKRIRPKMSKRARGALAATTGRETATEGDHVRGQIIDPPILRSWK